MITVSYFVSRDLGPTFRVQSCIAGVLVRQKHLPETMNPVVRPLMDAVKKETNIELQVSAISPGEMALNHVFLHLHKVVSI